jgi:hypothetical protein
VSGNYPIENSRKVRWHLTGFERDDRLCFDVEIHRDDVAALRHLFDRGDDEWMMFGEYPVAPELWPALRATLGPIDLSPGVTYFIGATQDLPRVDTAHTQSAVGSSETG